ncbi:hypothetical protein RHMOL_Rhmol13G0161100 [Rhododendron molle]|uniref:Uncharacterized protein n=1 Tax=Rhododendron molle TaxID=49168 RepID=A0ACC0L7B1_RHOML|nr:hypothetical protein RHMOL_Rhmol13G0161100 [Rhododendron molle]
MGRFQQVRSWKLSCMLSKALSKNFQVCSFSFVRRSCNTVAHELAGRGLRDLGFSLWTDSQPSWLVPY